MSTETEPRVIVVGTDEDGETAFIWVETRHSGPAARRPGGTIPSEDAARQAIVDTAREDWEQQLDPALIRPGQLCWFKFSTTDGVADDESVACDDDDPDRQDRFWLWDISEAVWSS